MADDFTEWAVFRRLEAYHGRFADAAWGAWNTWTKRMVPEVPAAHTRVRRTMMHSLFATELRKRFNPTDGITLHDTPHERFLMLVPSTPELGAFTVHVKHLDEELRTRNIPTKQAKKFDAQLPLPGIPRPRVTLGYRLNESETDIRDLHIVYARGRKVVWDYTINRPGSVTVAVFPPQQPLFPPSTPRVRAKQDVATQETSERVVGQQRLHVVRKPPSKPTKK